MAILKKLRVRESKKVERDMKEFLIGLLLNIIGGTIAGVLTAILVNVVSPKREGRPESLSSRPNDL
jgi:hypothetical protein